MANSISVLARSHKCRLSQCIVADELQPKRTALIKTILILVEDKDKVQRKEEDHDHWRDWHS